MKNPGARLQRLISLSGAGFVLLSLISMILSLGAPGLGWSVATITMVGVSLCSRLVGRRWLSACLALTAIHLFTLGPLARGAVWPSGTGRFHVAMFAALPFLAGIGALVGTYLRPRN